MIFTLFLFTVPTAEGDTIVNLYKTDIHNCHAVNLPQGETLIEPQTEAPYERRKELDCGRLMISLVHGKIITQHVRFTNSPQNS